MGSRSPAPRSTNSLRRICGDREPRREFEVSSVPSSPHPPEARSGRAVSKCRISHYVCLDRSFTSAAFARRTRRSRAVRATANVAQSVGRDDRACFERAASSAGAPHASSGNFFAALRPVPQFMTDSPRLATCSETPPHAQCPLFVSFQFADTCDPVVRP